ncbi:PREDICTED: cytoglobin-1-like [Nanorana parkeri]|uniref:cytoglobin-1-like n=1 Tax=Nanorana parkeri TaxID=125878 RepID=UPI000854EDD7|nr:PREDICTED: cytoglobin-1-like [Nanorana parkeri]
MGSIISGLRRPRRTSVSHAEPEQLVPTLDLSPHQHQLLVESWALIQQDIAKIGVIIFIRLFEVHPESKDFFLPFRNVDDLHELITSKDLRAHGLRVLSFVEKSIARIDNSDRLKELTLELGRSHYRYHAPPKYYQYVVAEFFSAIHPLLKDKWTPELENAWKNLFTYICALMRRGYDEEETKTAGKKSNTPIK